MTIAENGAPVPRYAYRILETRGTDSFLLLTWPSAVTGERRASLRIDYNGFFNHHPETELPLSVAAKEPDPEAWLQSRRAMHPMPRSGTLPEMGALAVYLASDLAGFVTGQAIAIDGGFSAR